MDRDQKKLTKDLADTRDAYKTAVNGHAALVEKRMEMEADKPLQKDAAIQRAMQGEVKQSYTAAEKTVESDPEYRAFLATYRQTVALENRAFGVIIAEKMRHDELLGLLAISGRELVRMSEVGS